MSGDRAHDVPVHVPYLRDPNYYRLSYQLVAQEANHAIAPSIDRPADPTLRGRTAERLVDEIDKELNDLERRQRRARWRPLKSLKVPELRLQRFLAGTVEPCTLLIVAADQSSSIKDPLFYLRRRLPKPRTTLSYGGVGRSPIEHEIPWSYRVYYNLACSRAAIVGRSRNQSARSNDTEPGASAEQRLIDDALAALEQAFRAVHGRPRAELWRWAANDPSLSSLRDRQSNGERFARILHEYAPRGVVVPPSRHPPRWMRWWKR
jgi:hypothetical protein